MGYDRYPRGANPQRDQYGRSDADDYGRDYGSGRDYAYSSARDYAASGAYDRDRGQRDDFGRYGQRDYGHAGYTRQDRDRGAGDDRGGRGDYYGSYGSDGRRFENFGNRQDHRDDRGEHARRRDQGYRGVPQGYDYEDRGFFARAGDEVKSWFGDDEAERRREADMRYDERAYGNRSHERDSDYGNWRSSQIAALDRDYAEYRHENRAKFENEFSAWRTSRQTQRDSLQQVKEHQDVVGSDGTHVGTVDKVRGDRIVLTKNDAEAGGRHHSIPSSWIAAVDDKQVKLSKTADEAKRHWRDEERNSALFGDRDADGGDAQGRMLNRSFSGTY